MPLSISGQWQKPIELDLDDGDLIYSCNSLENVTDSPGIYVFSLKFGRNWRPLYIGRSDNIQKRLWQHLNSVRLMKGIRNAGNGSRWFLACSFKPKPGQKMAQILRTAERALISHALGNGHELLQVQGTRRPAHKVSFRGNRASHALFGREVNLLA